MNRRQRIAQLVILQGFVQWAISQGIIKNHEETDILRRYMRQFNQKGQSSNDSTH